MTTQIENLETKVRQNIAIISEKFSYSESFSKKFHQKKTQIWENSAKVLDSLL